MHLDGKRVFDLVLTIPFLVLTLPLQGIVAALVRMRMGPPVIFKQERPGLHGRPFTLRKFRTMLPLDANAGQVDDDARLTYFGRTLRSTSLDELPSLWNIVRGDMSIVGPRPLLTEYLDKYTPEQARRHDVRPGLTGLAQVSGRNSLNWEDRFRLDLKYVENRSLSLDIRVIWASIFTVVKRTGVTGEGAATMTKFLGDRKGRIDKLDGRTEDCHNDAVPPIAPIA